MEHQASSKFRWQIAVAQAAAKDYYSGMKKLLWSIPAIAVYFYTATVLTNYGFISYFNIPSSFIDASLRDNIVFFYQLVTVYGSILSEMRWYVGAALGLAAGFIMLLCWYGNVWKGIFTTIGTVLLLLYLTTFFKLGGIIAAAQTSFLVPSSDCSVGSSYIIPVINGNQAVLVPIDQNHKMTGGFLVKNTADLSCIIEQKDIGKITP